MINDLWYKNAIIYSLSVATYMDANGDGVGDFQGLLRRLDYLNGMGITALWLMPFQPSPGKDAGYDIADYYGERASLVPGSVSRSSVKISRMVCVVEEKAARRCIGCRLSWGAKVYLDL
jgi:hypothetical protein